MKDFDYVSLNHLKISNEIVRKLTTIYQMRGETKSYQIDYHEDLKRLIAVAKVQSTGASNRIEQIYTSDQRLKEIMAQKVEPHNRNEREIAGYRDVLAQIHQYYDYMPITSNTILGMHKTLFEYTGDTGGGKFRDINNKIVEQDSQGQKRVRFNPPKAFLVPELVRLLCLAYNKAQAQAVISPLLLSAAFAFDFVSIHPFRDGNGRISRLLMLLTMYQLGFEVGKYISLEKIIEDSKRSYYEALAASSVNWDSNLNSYSPFMNYYLGIIIKAYRELIARIGIVHQSLRKLDAKGLILKTMREQMRPLSVNDLVALIPRYSKTTVQRNLHALKQAGKIKMIGASRNTSYVLVKN